MQERMHQIRTEHWEKPCSKKGALPHSPPGVLDTLHSVSIRGDSAESEMMRQLAFWTVTSRFDGISSASPAITHHAKPTAFSFSRIDARFCEEHVKIAFRLGKEINDAAARSSRPCAQRGACKLAHLGTGTGTRTAAALLQRGGDRPSCPLQGEAESMTMLQLNAWNMRSAKLQTRARCQLK